MGYDYERWQSAMLRNVWMRWETAKDITLTELEQGDPVWLITADEAEQVVQSEGTYMPDIKHRKIAEVTSIKLKEDSLYENYSYHLATVVYPSGKVRRLDTRLLYRLRTNSPEYALWLVENRRTR